MTDTRRRVKLYALNADRQWDDRGTGHVSSSYVDRLKGISLLVRAESDGTVLLESKIHPDTAYQKQQDTLIVWSEGDNFDLALSFQEKAGCDEIWEKICQVQGKDPSVEITQDIVEESEDERFDDMSDAAPPIELPPCELGRLEDINELIGNCLASPMRKEKLAVALESEGYIKKLLNLFHTCEDLENIEGLHHLYDIFKNIFLLNKNALFEVMFSDDTIFDVVGCLEYEPTLPQPKRHREYLRQLARFKQAIPITNAELLAKIHQTYRVQYIQDVVLPTPSVFEDNMLSTLSSFIFFNKVEIVTLIQDDEKFLTELFRQFTDESTSDSKRRDMVLFLKEFCNFSQNLQPQGKESFYKNLTALGILPALEITLAINDPQTKTASIDILTYIVEYSPSVVRDYTLQQINNTEQDQMLVNVIVAQLVGDSDPELGGAVQLAGVLRLLLDPENMLASVNKSEKTDFLNYFYKNSIGTLIAPLLANTIGERPAREDYRTVQLLGLILELLSFCVEHHTYHIKNCILNKDLLRRILVLMKSTHTFLVLCALRFMRKIIALKDEFYNRYIIKGNLFAPVFDAFVRNNGRYNLLDSAILEMFEFIKLEDIKSLCSHVVENFSKELEAIDYVQTFKALKLRYEQHQDKLKDRDRTTLDRYMYSSVPSILRNSRYRRDQRQLDEEEEMWFREEEDFDEGEAVVPAATADLVPPASAKKQSSSSNSALGPSLTESKNHQQQQQQQSVLNNNTANNNITPQQTQVNNSTSTTNENPVTPEITPSSTIGTVEKAGIIIRKGLVDYEEDSDEEDEDSGLSPSPKRQRLSW
ncbi:serine/threonine-protein phosphatase 4 regulatory subunit 3 isoform X1 [Vespula pensylvanica]|uniref:serine/threonine-protein phosphatase 4 regulatory subunit 3 isoform X1 n=1 Tax=Vespula pensylvanica TaxID=30213 RepID=UPI001CB9F1E3|nr:serine/threonine-protein phosphatase 4 regulatory subunit 3 isoform X1 [Vespula pensylvanica]